MHNTDAFLQEIYARELNSEFENVESTEGVDSAQAATATLHKEWRDNRLGIFKGSKPFRKYYKQGESRNSDHQAGLTQICQI